MFSTLLLRIAILVVLRPALHLLQFTVFAILFPFTAHSLFNKEQRIVPQSLSTIFSAVDDNIRARPSPVQWGFN